MKIIIFCFFVTTVALAQISNPSKSIFTDEEFEREYLKVLQQNRPAPQSIFPLFHSKPSFPSSPPSSPFTYPTPHFGTMNPLSSFGPQLDKRALPAPKSLDGCEMSEDLQEIICPQAVYKRDKSINTTEGINKHLEKTQQKKRDDIKGAKKS